MSGRRSSVDVRPELTRRFYSTVESVECSATKTARRILTSGCWFDSFQDVDVPRSAAGAFLLLASAHAAAQPAPTFSQQIAPILRTHCASCHQPDGDAPFSLISFEDARRRANQIAEVTSRRYMPPWKPDDAGVFTGERRLSDHDIDTIRRWARAGAPEGTPSGRASTTDRASRWRNGEPDLIVTLPAYTLRADGPDVFRNFVVTIPGADAHYVRAWQFSSRQPGRAPRQHPRRPHECFASSRRE